MKYLYDTNIFIYYLADDITVNSWFTEEFLNLHEILVSPIIRIELLSFAGLSKEEEQSIEDLLSHLPHPKLSHNEKWSFGDLGLAIAT
ncbi:hypothetical protein MEO40_18070 [Dolichospermum sp. ST_sed1]|nr:hypothetical protein [Dolichospermum sp. ST_sed1]MDD1423508.1 hypothetical protein [Dolichospermum sp. ST_sed9]MDD1433036.1 hypothetical protein [Dolichospermum sp. ST_sed6]MDD1434952.1 hypothetical protein [Dolichospermum sp. ST_sed10]MDD1438971.1 hypothetical protein [Dolichospermum sp. ST_sed3]MDD1445324.1 hypothetical protein [Dolichospermum sp. ST_sed8]MDD1455383.1 hypothetical protein [Dolichospermum sp. ST_sed7]MDD1461287.1 hypothetical protein [Dolichospermum sp. ST_sed2]MDD14705